MHIAYLVITLLFAFMVSFSGAGKILRNPLQVKVVHETVGVPLKYFPLLAACEFAGAVGLVVGIWWPVIGIAAGIGLVLYFCGSHHGAPARERCQRQWIRRIHVGACRVSARSPGSDNLKPAQKL